VMALARVGAKALMTCGHVGGFNHGQFAMRVAAEVFSIRYVCAFGENLPDGVVAFDDLLAAETFDLVPALDRQRQNHSAAHVAAITFDVGEGGLVPVARNHAELLAAGLAVLLEGRLAQDTIILSALVPSSFAGMSLTLLPWLLSGGTLVLHHPFDPRSLAQQQNNPCNILILPGPVAFHLCEAGIFAGGRPTSVIAAWHSPEQLAASPSWREPSAALVDVPIFGEVVLAPARREADGRPGPVQFGPLTAPRGGNGGAALAELVRTDTGTVAARGPMVPLHPFPPGIERSNLPYFKIGRGGLVDTGYSCRVDSVTKAMVVTGPPSGLVSVGGYRFALRDLQDAASRIDARATLTALPDPLLGHRLIGNAADRDTMQAALSAVGVNPLVVAAFRDRSAQSLLPANAA
jgi:hypothetical protein